MSLQQSTAAGTLGGTQAPSERLTGSFLSNFTISTKLVAGFAAISLVATMIGVTGLYFINNINSTLNNITDVAAPTVETSDDLIALIFESTKVAEEIIGGDDMPEIDPLVEELQSLDVAFDQTYLELQDLVSDESLLDELDTARREQIEFMEHSVQMIAAHRLSLSKGTQAINQLITFDDTGTQITTALDEFAEENEAEMAKAEEEGDQLELIGANGATVNRVLGQLFDQDYPVVEAALKLQRLVIEMQDTAGEYLAEKNHDKLRPIELNFLELHKKVSPHIEILQMLAESREDEEDTDALKSMLQRWVNLAVGKDQLFDTHKAMLESASRADELTTLLENDADNAVAALDKVAETADAISDGADEAAEHAVTQASTTIFVLLVLAVIGSVALLGLIVMVVVRPITNLTRAMVSLSEHYGPAMAPELQGRDEVGRLRLAFDHLEAQVQQRTKQLQQRTSELDSANQHLEQELSQRQSLERQLVHAQKLDSLGTLAGGIAHDFNNMIYVILGCTKIALADLKDNSSIKQLILKIDQAAQRSKSIVAQVLFFSRQETPNRKPLDISQTVQESITLLRAGLPTSMVLEVAIGENCGTVLADETQIQQLTVNLVTNAFQAHNDGKGTIELELKHVDVEAQLAERHLGLHVGPYICLSVTDHGCGILDDDLPRIYDPFFTTKPVGEGTGLGLAVVHGIVKSHEGEVVVRTKVGQGTTFEIYLPQWNGGQYSPREHPSEPHRATGLESYHG